MDFTSNERLCMKSNVVGKCGMLVVAVGAVLAGLVGCEAPERYVYRSETTLPATVSLVDATNNENLLTVEVEPGKQLVLQFKETPTVAEGLGKDELQWIVTPWDNLSLTGANRMTVPPPSGRRIEVSYREPEKR